LLNKHLSKSAFAARLSSFSLFLAEFRTKKRLPASGICGRSSLFPACCMMVAKLILVMDFSKAFDKVCHRHLITKLIRGGIHGKNRLHADKSIPNQQQRVLLAGVSSDDVEVLSDVRSVIGPCLCLIYINSLSESLTSNAR